MGFERGFMLSAAVLSATGSFKRAASNPRAPPADKDALALPANAASPGKPDTAAPSQSQHAEQPAEHVRAPCCITVCMRNPLCELRTSC